MADEPIPSDPADRVKDAVALAGAHLHEVRAALARVTGGAPASLVLAELAQEMASELGAHFDDLPMHRFAGRVARVAGPLGAAIPGRRVAHRVLLARYLSASPPMRGGEGHVLRWADMGLVALGADGVLRAGSHRELVRLAAGIPVPDGPLPWDDARVRRIPTRAVRLARWPGARVKVATAAQVLDALAAVAALVAASSRHDLELLQRLIPPAD